MRCIAHALTFVLALGDLVGPHANSRLTVVRQTGRALVAGRLAVPTVPEGVALLLVGEDSVQPRAVGSADSGLCNTKQSWSDE